MKVNKFSNMLGKALKENSLSQSEFGKAIGFSQQAISDWVNGSREPDYDTLIKIAKHFKESTDYILGLED
jgi:transcriptional regulator with XRE-family HTH domain